MPAVSDASFDVASAISKGQRPYQEDALVTDFSLGSDFGFVVLADGMGGHAAGDVASKIVVTEVFSELKLQSGESEAFRENLPEILHEAALAANACVRGHIETNSETAGMGATLLASVLVGPSLYWISIGDSPLFLFRDGALRQINEDHSMAPQIDFMIKTGILSEDVGRNHPDRSCLISVLGGEDIPRIDCPAEPLHLRHGDILIAASDGLQYLTSDEIEDILITYSDKPSTWLANALLAQLEAYGDPEQDNASFAVVKVALQDAAGKAIPASVQDAAARSAPPAGFAARAPSRLGSVLLNKGASLFRSGAQ